MYRRIYGSQGIPRHMWGVLHINTKRQASRLCPPLVPVSALSMNAAAACGLSAGIPCGEAMSMSALSVSDGSGGLTIFNNAIVRSLLAGGAAEASPLACPTVFSAQNGRGMLSFAGRGGSCVSVYGMMSVKWLRPLCVPHGIKSTLPA